MADANEQVDAIRIQARFPRPIEVGTVFQTLGQVVTRDSPCIKLHNLPPPHGFLVETLAAGLVFGPVEAWEPAWLTYKGKTAMTIAIRWTYQGMKVWTNICHGDTQYCIMRPDLKGSDVTHPGELNVAQKLEIGGGTLAPSNLQPSWAERARTTHATTPTAPVAKAARRGETQGIPKAKPQQT